MFFVIFFFFLFLFVLSRSNRRSSSRVKLPPANGHIPSLQPHCPRSTAPTLKSRSVQPLDHPQQANRRTQVLHCNAHHCLARIRCQIASRHGSMTPAGLLLHFTAWWLPPPSQTQGDADRAPPALRVLGRATPGSLLGYGPVNLPPRWLAPRSTHPSSPTESRRPPILPPASTLTEVRCVSGCLPLSMHLKTSAP